MKSIFLQVRMFAVSLTAMIYLTSAGQTSSYSGLYGRALKNAIAQNRPTETTVAAQNINELLIVYDNKCMLTGVTVANPDCEQLVPALWIVTPATYAKDIANDLFNQLVVDAQTAQARNGLPLGDAASTDYRVFEPSPQQKGALARAIFYVATLYPADIWEGNGAVVFRDFSPYPTLTTELTEVYLKWNRDYPPNVSEKLANDRIEALQGNRNVYIDFPGLIEHIWGEKKNIPYGDTSSTATTPMLKSRYFNDETIYFHWPSADNDAVWTLDGNRVKLTEIPASELKPGQHEIAFKTKNKYGRIIITIEQQ